MHFTAFHPEFKMLDVAPTPPATLTRAREIAVRNGMRYAYTGNVHDAAGSSTYCHGCEARVIERDWYQLGKYGLDEQGRCNRCATPCAGRFSGPPSNWGRHRMAVRLA